MIVAWLVIVACVFGAASLVLSMARQRSQGRPLGLGPAILAVEIAVIVFLLSRMR